MSIISIMKMIIVVFMMEGNFLLKPNQGNVYLEMAMKKDHQIKKRKPYLKRTRIMGFVLC